MSKCNVSLRLENLINLFVPLHERFMKLKANIVEIYDFSIWQENKTKSIMKEKFKNSL